jgi:hypothetical protein
MPDDSTAGLGNLELQKQFSELLEARAKILEKNNKEMSAANQLSAAFSSLMSNGANTTNSAAEALIAYTAHLEKMAKKSEEATERQKELEGQQKKTAQKTAFVSSVFGMFGKAASLTFSALKMGVKVVFSLAGTFFNLAKSIISLPFAMLSGLIEMANNLPDGVNPIRQALEDMKAAFGDLATNEGKLLKSSLHEIRMEARNLAGTGMSVRKMFGAGPEGIAAAMKYFQEIATALGPSLNRLQGDIKGNIPEVIALTKGFTGSADATAAMLKHFKSLGEKPVQSMIKLTSMAQRMGKTYGINAKIIGKSIGEMVKDISNFGSMSKTQLVAAAVYANKLGIEIQDLGNVMNKFLNFEDAAKGAAEMAQAFGMNVDTLQLMQGGPEAIDEMRKAFFATGRTIKDLSNAERKLFENITSLTGASLEAAFSTESQGTAFADLKSSAEDAESVQEKQIKVMRELGKSIERVFGSGGNKFKSFFEAFAKGFSDGFARASSVRDLLYNIRVNMRLVEYGARAIGKAFVDAFPGLDQFIGGINDFLFGVVKIEKDVYGVEQRITKFTLLMRSLGESMKKLFSDISDPKKKDGAVGRFLENLKKAFSDSFSVDGTKGIQEGGAKIADTLLEIFTQLTVIAIDGMAKVIDGLLNGSIIEDAKKTPLVKSLEKIKDRLSAAFEPIKKKLQEQLDRLLPIINEKITKYLESDEFKQIKDKVTNALVSVLLGAFTAVAASLAIGAGLKLLGKNIVNKMLKEEIFELKGAEKFAAEKASEAASKINAKVSSIFSKSAESSAKITGKITEKITNITSRAGKAIESKAPSFTKFGSKFSEGITTSLTGIGSKVGGTLSTVSSKIGSGALKLVSGASKILGIVALPLAVATAFTDMSEVTKKETERLSKDFDAASAKTGAGAAGIVNALTFGLADMIGLTPAIGTAFATVSNAVYGAADTYLGPTAGEDLRTIVTGGLDVFSGLGDLLMAIWDGDTAGVSTAFTKIKDGFLDYILGIFDILPEIIGKITEWTFSIAGWLSTKIGDIFTSLQDIPVIGGVFKLLGKLFHGIGTILKVLGKSISLFVNVFGSVVSFLFGIIMPIGRLLWDFFYAPFDIAFTAIGDVISWGLEKFSELIQWIKEKFGLDSPASKNVLSWSDRIVEAINFIANILDPSTIAARVDAYVEGMKIAFENGIKRVRLAVMEGMNAVKEFLHLSPTEIPADLLAVRFGSFSEDMEAAAKASAAAAAKYHDQIDEVVRDRAAAEAASREFQFGPEFDFEQESTIVNVERIREKAKKAKKAINEEFQGPMLENSFTPTFDFASQHAGVVSQTSEMFKDVKNAAAEELKFETSDFNLEAMESIPETMQSIPEAMQSIPKAMKSIPASGLENVSKNFHESLSEVPKSFETEMVSTFDALLDRVPEFVKQFIESLKDIRNPLIKSAEMMQEPFSGIFNGLVAFPMENFIEQLELSVNKILDIGDQFARSMSFDAIVDLTESLNSSRTVTVDVAGMTCNLNMTVNIDAEKLAENLIKTDVYKKASGLK